MKGGADNDQIRLTQFQIDRLSDDEIIKKAKILMNDPTTTFEVHPLDNALIHMSAQYYASRGVNVTESVVLEKANETVESVLARYNNGDAFKRAWKNNGDRIELGWKSTLEGILRVNLTSGKKKRKTTKRKTTKRKTTKRKTIKRKNKRIRTRRFTGKLDN